MEQQREMEATDVLAAPSVVLMFSGGRDSALAAVRLHREGHSVTLVTVSSSHLHGIGAVHQRLAELKKVLPSSTLWLRVTQPRELPADATFSERTCLPCHHAYVLVAMTIAYETGAANVAFGYAGYQAGWPEQSSFAIARLASTLEDHALHLLLPVYNLRSKDDAKLELKQFGMSLDALEQKCVQQIKNIRLAEPKLHEQILLWEKAIRKSGVNARRLKLNVLARQTLGEL